MKRRRPRPHPLLVALLPLLCVGAAVTGWVGLDRFLIGRKALELRQTTELLAQGYEWAARDVFERREAELVKSRDGCALLVRLYSAEKDSDRLGAVAEACMEGGIEVREVFSGLARHRGWIGDTDGEIRFLIEASERFPNIWGSFHELAVALHRVGRNSEAANAYLKATEMNPGGVELAIEALEFMEDTGRPREAFTIARTLLERRDPAMNTARSFLLIARALLGGPDPGSASAVVVLARGFLKDKPLLAGKLRKEFPRELALGI
jgi:tetratricopeptide (TPR) repeat protein